MVKTFIAPLALFLLAACGATQSPRASTDGARPTETFRAHHAEIKNKLDDAAAHAMALSSATPEEASELFHRIVHFFHHELIPHAEAEERILYAAADRLVQTAHGRRYTDALRYEHTVIARQVQALHAAMQRDDRSPEAIDEFQRRTLELVGLIDAHFGVEENVVLTAFDEQMSAEEFDREVVQPMHAESGGAAHHHGEHAHE